jgi:hypothetical protein
MTLSLSHTHTHTCTLPTMNPLTMKRIPVAEKKAHPCDSAARSEHILVESILYGVLVLVTYDRCDSLPVENADSRDRSRDNSVKTEDHYFQTTLPAQTVDKSNVACLPIQMNCRRRVNDCDCFHVFCSSLSIPNDSKGCTAGRRLFSLVLHQCVTAYRTIRLGFLRLAYGRR